MKSYKLFTESIEDTEPQIDDYAICQFEDTKPEYSQNDIKIHNSIGVIKTILTQNHDEYPYYVIFPNGEANYFKRNEIKFFTKNKEEAELYMNANKYNL